MNARLLSNGDRDRIQTYNPHIRSVVLYSVELRSHLSLASAKIRLFFNLAMRILKKNRYMKNCASFEHKDTKAQSRYRKANITQ